MIHINISRKCQKTGFSVACRRPGKALSIFLLVLVLAAAIVSGACSASASPTNSAPTSTTPTTATTTAPAASLTTAADGYQTITPEAAKKMLSTQQGIILLDVRTAEEYKTGHLAGSQLLPVEELADRSNELPAAKDTPIIVYCRSGRRSKIAADELITLGYTRVFDLGGLQDWPYETEAG
jgi:phage shock protein E